MGRHMIRLIIL